MLVTFEEPSLESTGVGNGKGGRMTWLSSDLLLELRHQGKLCGHWKQEHVTQEDYTDVVHHSRENICGPKTPAEFQLASIGKDKKKGFLKEVNSKRSIRENIGLLLDEVGYFPQRDTDKAQPFNASSSPRLEH